VSPFCHRCAHSLEARTAFCPACGAPQIRVAAPEAVPAQEPDLAADPTPPQFSPEDAAFSTSPSAARDIKWKAFLRIALPLAFLSGTVCAFFPPLGLALLPGSVILGIARYRREYEARVTPSQGGWLGACTGLLSFAFFLIFAGITMALNRAEVRDLLVKTMQEQMSRNPDPNFQQMANWAVTPMGLAFALVVAAIMFLALFVALATVAGTLTAAISGNRHQR